ncbi:MAG: thioredoxin family protein [Candidatus Sungbacteria bacterium]|nr:thioredoxin family protein [Candidatus Sungbacteria bacterium]
MKPITLDVLASPGCHVCKLFEEFWHSIEKGWPNVTFRHIEVTTPEGQELAGKYMILASPGIIVNGQLWATGGFDREKFIAKLTELS